MNYLLNRRLFLKLLGLVPVLKKVLEPAPEVVQPMKNCPWQPEIRAVNKNCRCAMCSLLRRQYAEMQPYLPEMYRRKSL